MIVSEPALDVIFRCRTAQGASLIVAARALRLCGGPMSVVGHARVDVA